MKIDLVLYKLSHNYIHVPVENLKYIEDLTLIKKMMKEGISR